MRRFEFEKKITKAQYKRSQKNNGFLTRSDENSVLTLADSAYGVTCGKTFERDGKYFVSCTSYDSCD